ncbi:peptidase M20 domain-containing protein 2 [Elysia marginata]|uniref:Peptidase M20 domain-containing protein 2 n=1 Tax=Elysia marginata TaxID=1093978 RepID=A0AAV4IUE4_9GAST|nr:peptidase M20 domain-containing protein 2 [Elysia marginata]
MIDKNNSFSSSNDISFVLQQMFPTAAVAKKFTCGETESMYLAMHGIAPYCSSLLHKRTLQEPYVSLSDENLNKHMQTKQMDLWLRIWNVDTVESRNFESSFLGHACASDLLICFEEKVAGKLGLAHMAQLSMDGPYVNWATFENFRQRLKRKHQGN